MSTPSTIFVPRPKDCPLIAMLPLLTALQGRRVGSSHTPPRRFCAQSRTVPSLANPRESFRCAPALDAKTRAVAPTEPGRSVLRESRSECVGDDPSFRTYVSSIITIINHLHAKLENAGAITDH